ncbi:MAG: histidinol dehydrogenase, partial [Bacteroidales bacterium]
MKVYIYPDKKEWAEIITRPALDYSDLSVTVTRLLDDIRKRGDEALREYEERFDGVQLDQLKVSDAEFEEGIRLTDPALKDAIDRAITHIEIFHSSQQIKEERIETTPGVICWQKAIGIDKV